MKLNILVMARYFYSANIKPDCNNITFLKSTSLYTVVHTMLRKPLLANPKIRVILFRFAAPKLWNTLPNNITMSNNFNVFYAGLNKFIFNFVKL